MLTEAQRAFIDAYLLKRTQDGGTGMPDVNFKVLAGRIASIVADNSGAKRPLEGLLKAAQAAVAGGDASEAKRQLELLQDSLESWSGAGALPNLKDVLDGGLAELSRTLSPEDIEGLAEASEQVDEVLAVLPDHVQKATKVYTAEISQLRARGDRLVKMLESGSLPPFSKAAHHNEIDQICLRIEARTAEMKKILEKENVL